MSPLHHYELGDGLLGGERRATAFAAARHSPSIKVQTCLPKTFAPGRNCRFFPAELFFFDPENACLNAGPPRKTSTELTEWPARKGPRGYDLQSPVKLWNKKLWPLVHTRATKFVRAHDFPRPAPEVGKCMDFANESKQSISVITVVLDDFQGIQKTEESVVGQLDAFVEWVIVDGHSSEPLKSHLNKLEQNPRISLIRSPPTGIYPAMNTGLSAASGEWCWFINAGDAFLSRTTFLDIRELLSEPQSFDLLATAVDYLTAQGHLIARANPHMEKNGDTLIAGFHHQGCLFRRQALSDLGGFDTGLELAADGKAIDAFVKTHPVSVDFRTFVGFSPGGASTVRLVDVIRETNSFRPGYYSGVSIGSLKIKNFVLRAVLLFEKIKITRPLVTIFLKRRARRLSR